MNEDDFLYAPIVNPAPDSTDVGVAGKTVIRSFQNNPLVKPPAEFSQKTPLLTKAPAEFSQKTPLLSAAQLLGFESTLLQQLARYQQHAYQQAVQQGLQNYQNEFYKSQSKEIMEGQTQQLANQSPNFAGETSCGVFDRNSVAGDVAQSGW